MNGTIGSVIEANLSFKNKDFYIDYSTEDTVKIDLSAPKEADGVKVSGSTVTITEAGTYVPVSYTHLRNGAQHLFLHGFLR